MSIRTKLLRCALYTRKSSEEGLEQEFNSLDAQREACEAYVKSQAHEGWRPIETHYDDGGYSGGSMERPGLQHLMADIAAGKVDIVVVYKIDRLTRSLPDFARMVELFDKHEVSFVSVTQSFNTTSSMGRLTLNVLLSFAQFEREVTGERIRDKIAASKAKGMWMGGMLPLGYDLPKDKSRTLVLNETEAATVRLIFNRYLELSSVHTLRDWLSTEGITSKQWTSSKGKPVGGHAFSRGALYHLLRNETYLGYIRHKGTLYEADHPPIISKELFDKVQSALDAGSNRHAKARDKRSRAPLTGRLFDANGEAMSPSTATGKHGRKYRYYVSSSLLKGSKPKTSSDQGGTIIQRISADALEGEVTQLIARLVPTRTSDAMTLASRIEVHRGAIHFVLPKSECRGLESRLTNGETIKPHPGDVDSVLLLAPIRMRNRRGRTEITSGQQTSKPNRDPILINALRRAHAMVEQDTSRLPICRTSPPTQYARRLIRLAFLAPDLQKKIMDGTQPKQMNLEDLLKDPIPINWDEQRAMFEHG